MLDKCDSSQIKKYVTRPGVYVDHVFGQDYRTLFAHNELNNYILMHNLTLTS
ncbi:hypothetical protein TUM19329_35750 (plasmid) [Legionella antarctica]|uniref:Uncharacterized protein n=1 Tax=Legionella antarctica TaxID=2708020 RepID=A0A6F8T946_9GAMM|nr:hypothetical protein TUM19329_00260 [Legionella antarctica]BCA97214.1 hypothetical protein TUM19329_35750 [Legionella antarctica]